MDTDDKLLALNDLSDQTRIALDSEFIRRKTYYPILSLVQLATDKKLYLIDSLAVDDLKPLCGLLADSRVEKVFHSVYQDAEILGQLCKKKIHRVFDTQLAAAFLGFQMQISYKALVQVKLDITLNKSETQSDWLRRPLSKRQLKYAEEDVAHLFELQDILLEELHNSGKYRWFAEEIKRRMSADNDYCKQFLDKNANMHPHQLARLKALLEWREQKARLKNLPRQWIAADACLKELAMQGKPSSGMKSKNCAKTPDYRMREMLERLDGTNLKRPPEAPQKQTGKQARLNAVIKERSGKMRRAADRLANEHNIAPALIINRKELHAIASGSMQASDFPGWRAEFVRQIIQYSSW